MRTSRFAEGAALIATALAVVALAGWFLDHDLLRSALPRSVPMNPATAVAFLCAAASLWLQSRGGAAAPLGRALALVTVGLGAWKVAAIVLGPDAHFDRFLFPVRIETTWPVPNRMAPNTAIGFTLLGGGLLLIQQRKFAVLAQGLAVASGCLGFFAILGHLYGLANLYGVAEYIPMAFNTAIALTMLSGGVLAIRPTHGLVTVFTMPGAGGYLARRLLPAAILLPAFLGALRLWGEDAGIYGRETGPLLFVLATTLLISALVAWTARALDRTDRRHREAERRIKDLYNNAPCGYHSLDENGVFVDMNDTELAWLGHERDAVIGRLRFLDVITPESRDSFQRNFPVFKQRGEMHGLEFDMVRKNGSTFPVSLSATAVFDESGRYVRSRSTIFDITERKRAEGARAHLAAIVESSHDAIFSGTLDGTILSWNAGAEKLYGYTAEEFIGSNVRRLVPPARQEEEPALIERIRRGARIEQFETVRVRKDGSDVTVLQTASPIRDTSGRVVAVSVVSHDITVRKQAEDRVRLLNRELEAFSYSVSHDLRAPLRAIVGFSQALLEDHGAELGDGGRRLTERIVAGGRRMGALIDDLLAFSRISRAELRRQPVNLTHQVREIEAGLRESEPDRQVEVVVEEGLGTTGDSRLLRVALENLVSNAWKFTRQKGNARVEVGVSANGEPRAFFVKDNGAGFDMQYADKLFAPFQRLHPASEFEGTGIGLATVQRIIERHGGRVWAEGAVGMGATIYFTLGEC